MCPEDYSFSAGRLCPWIKGEQGAPAELYTEQAVSLHLTQDPRPAPQKGRKKRMMAHLSFQGPGEPGAESRSWGGDETVAALLEDLSPLPHPHALAHLTLLTKHKFKGNLLRITGC